MKTDRIVFELNQAQFAVLLLSLNQIEHDLETAKPHYTEAQLKLLPSVTNVKEHIKETAFNLSKLSHRHLKLLDHTANVLLEKEYEIEADLLASDEELLQKYEIRDPRKLREAIVYNLDLTEQANLLMKSLQNVFSVKINEVVK